MLGFFFFFLVDKIINESLKNQLQIKKNINLRKIRNEKKKKKKKNSLNHILVSCVVLFIYLFIYLFFLRGNESRLIN